MESLRKMIFLFDSFLEESFKNFYLSFAVASLLVFLSYLFLKKFRKVVNNYLPNLSEKVVIVTGSTSGIGYEAAKAFASMGATVILANRASPRAVYAHESIKRINPKTMTMELDCANLDSVRNFVKNFRKLDIPLDILVNNAGTFTHAEKTRDSFEPHMGVNYVSPFVLTNELLPHLEKSRGRIINVSSSAHKLAKGPLVKKDFFLHKQDFYDFGNYCKSKLAMELFTFELDQRLRERGSPVIVAAVNPGLVQTPIFREHLLWRIWATINPIAKTPEEGAQTTIWAAVHPSIQSGKYYCDLKEDKHGEQVNPESARNFWKLTEDVLNEKMETVATKATLKQPQ